MQKYRNNTLKGIGKKVNEIIYITILLLIYSIYNIDYNLHYWPA